MGAVGGTIELSVAVDGVYNCELLVGNLKEVGACDSDKLLLLY